MLFPGATVGGGRVVNLGLSFSSHIFARLAGGPCARKEESSFRLLGIQGRCTRSALVRSDEDTMTRAKPLQVASCKSRTLACLWLAGLVHAFTS